jgi:ABC-type glycerol-3-phosphate transport system substrate-binding protein
MYTRNLLILFALCLCAGLTACSGGSDSKKEPTELTWDSGNWDNKNWQ